MNMKGVSIRRAKDKQHFCSGTILNSQWILTAAHCFTFFTSPKDIVVQYGSNELKPHYPSHKNVERIVKHEGYNPTVTIHDIALLKLESPLPFYIALGHVNLPKDTQTQYENKDVTLIGWGLNECFQTMGSLTSRLNKVSLKTITLNECRLSLLSVVHKTNLCAGGNGKGQCSGDSGGPLMLNNRQIGVVSWSLKPCAKKPGVFTNVSYYIDWIKETIKE
ncbi:trypsin-like [Musca autumnalis]|uniref:trypsin-like n=1 Tax=Musca autumnalis TaxID=221902 RepID=UPI003CF9AA71